MWRRMVVTELMHFGTVCCLVQHQSKGHKTKIQSLGLRYRVREAFLSFSNQQKGPPFCIWLSPKPNRIQEGYTEPQTAPTRYYKGGHYSDLPDAVFDSTFI